MSPKFLALEKDRLVTCENPVSEECAGLRTVQRAFTDHWHNFPTCGV